MKRQTALQVSPGVVGVVFVALAYPMALFIRQESALSMMLCVYATLGVFLLPAIREPGAILGRAGIDCVYRVVEPGACRADRDAGSSRHGGAKRVDWRGRGLVVIGVIFLVPVPAKRPAV